MSEGTPVKVEKSLKIGQKVDVCKDGNKFRGTVAYVGTTLFSPGKWIGVILEEKEGKNNGTVMAKTYFSCKNGHGMFVRQSNCILVDDISDDTNSGAVSTPIADEKNKSAKSRLPVASTPKASAQASNQTGQSNVEETPTSKEDSVPSTPRGELTKRSSFVETGFVETLKTQFTPGQPLSPSLSMAIEERATGLQLQHENDNLKAEIRDLNEKLETIKVRRSQDKDKLKEADKMRLQLDQLLEFKKAILESQSQLQKELQRVKHEAKETLVEQQSKLEESDEYQEMLEMATLDKEMAEEKAESLQLELEQAKQKIEELALDLELLKAEMSDKGGESVGSSLEMKQLEQQNGRMKETLVKMRDLAAHEKLQQQRLMKELEDKISEINDIKKSKQVQTVQLEGQQSVIAELQEQVDAALGSEEMVEQLTDRNLALEEKINELLDAVADLEQLYDMNEELQETARETELELREELELSRTKIQEGLKERDAAQEVVADRNATIDKFRQVVQQLQDSNQKLRDDLQRETNKPVGAPAEVIDYQKMFSETKTFTKTIDLELRKLEVQQALQHVNYLCNYMPDSFMARGGDYHSVQQLLLMARMLFKCEMLSAQVREKFAPAEKWDASSIKSPVAEQFSFGSRLLHLLLSIQGVVRQYSLALGSCSPQQFLEIGAVHAEMSQQEKALDMYVDLLRKDQLDENIQLDPLEKIMTYFNSIYTAHFSSLCHGVSLLTDHSKVLLAVSDGLTVLSHRVQHMMQTGYEGSDVAISIKEILNQATLWQQFARVIKRRLPADGSTGPINLPPEVQPKLLQAGGYLSKLLKTLNVWCRTVSQQLSITAESDAGVPVTKIRELAHAAADQIYIDDCLSDSGFFDSIHASLSFVTSTFSTVSTALVDGHYDFDGTPPNEVKTAPVILRAQMIKAEIKELENLRHKLDERESIIKEINVHLRAKQEELSEMNIRKEMTEKKLSNHIRDHEVALEKLTRKLEDNQLLLKRKEKEFNETLEHLQSDMETLEKEKAELKERLMHSSKKVLLEGLSKSATSAVSPASPTPFIFHPTGATSTPTQSSVSSRDSPLLLTEIAHLRAALNQSQSDKARLTAAQLQAKVDSLTPLQLPKKNVSAAPSSELNILIKQVENLKLNVLKSCSQVKLIDPSSKKSSYQSTNASIQYMLKWEQMEREVLKLQASVARMAAIRQPGGEIKTGLISFPTPELTKAMSINEHEKIGQLVLPLPDQTEEKQPIPVLLDMKDLRHLHGIMFPSV